MMAEENKIPENSLQDNLINVYNSHLPKERIIMPNSYLNNTEDIAYGKGIH
jgi:hypothetical protein